MEKGTLIVGLDDSNHAGKSPGEIITATFSFCLEDSVVKTFPNRRDYQMFERWINSPERDFRFGILMDEKYRHSHTNLISIAPLLIKSYLIEKK